VESIGRENDKRRWSKHIEIDVSKKDYDYLRSACREAMADILFIDYCGMDSGSSKGFVICIFTLK
jgi:hypothetical protein